MRWCLLLMRTWGFQEPHGVRYEADVGQPLPLVQACPARSLLLAHVLASCLSNSPLQQHRGCNTVLFALHRILGPSESRDLQPSFLSLLLLPCRDMPVCVGHYVLRCAFMKPLCCRQGRLASSSLLLLPFLTCLAFACALAFAYLAASLQSP